MKYTLLSALSTIAFVLLTITSSAQARFKGLYIVVVDSVKAIAQDTLIPDYTFRYGDSVRVVTRPTATQWGIKFEGNDYVIPRSAVATHAVFDRMEDSTDPNDPSHQSRPHAFRFGLSLGACMPIEDASVIDPGLSYSISVDVLVNSGSIHLTFGYESNTIYSVITSINDVDLDLKLTTGALNVGVIYGLTEGAQPVNPFIRAGFALTTDGRENIIFLTGVGVDYYASSTAILFIEVEPTIEVSGPGFIWMPIRAGARVAF